MLPQSRTACISLSRSFSTSCRVLSHIGREPIKFSTDVTLTRTPKALTIKGPKGTTSVPLHPFVQLDMATPNTLSVAVEDAKIKQQRQMWGTTRTLISNAITGMTEGFTVPLYLVGVGYRAALENQGETPILRMKLGHSHFINIEVPSHIKLEVPSPTKVVLSCTDKHLLGLFAAQVRAWRKPEVYKGKGVFIGNEQIRLKSVKKK
ncbi:50s ribosomal protein [Coprinopsis marcescibilis]|uniref:50s ribosomal protein n=1 Tax=Coprinopsis marcescibilis TaxID=230819 RepID=A0A5C3L603_COPMA|nr:50s ribosomal protein [Coprinopsis marcescibilis]